MFSPHPRPHCVSKNDDQKKKFWKIITATLVQLRPSPPVVPHPHLDTPILSYQGTVMLVSGAVHHEAPMDRCLSLCIPTLLCTLFFLVLKKTKPYPFKVPNFGWQCYATNRNQRKIVGFSTGSDGELPSLGNRLSSTQQLSDLNFVTVRTVVEQIETVTHIVIDIDKVDYVRISFEGHCHCDHKNNLLHLGLGLKNFHISLSSRQKSWWKMFKFGMSMWIAGPTRNKISTMFQRNEIDMPACLNCQRSWLIWFLCFILHEIMYDDAIGSIVFAISILRLSGCLSRSKRTWSSIKQTSMARASKKSGCDSLTLLKTASGGLALATTSKKTRKQKKTSRWDVL